MLGLQENLGTTYAMLLIFLPLRSSVLDYFILSNRNPLCLMCANEEFIERIWGKSRAYQTLERAGLGLPKTKKSEAQSFQSFLGDNYTILLFCS